MSKLAFTKLNSNLVFLFLPTIKSYEVDLLSFLETNSGWDLDWENIWKPKTSGQSGSISRWFGGADEARAGTADVLVVLRSSASSFQSNLSHLPLLHCLSCGPIRGVHLIYTLPEDVHQIN